MTAPRQETKVDLGTLLSGAGALLLLISLFLDWYGDPDDSAAISAWTSFELLDVVLAALALAVLYEVVTRLSTIRRWPASTSLLPFAGPVALVLVVVSMIDEPPVAFFIAPDLEVGIWLALGAAVLMTVGSLLGRVRISVVATPRDRETETRPLP